MGTDARPSARVPAVTDNDKLGAELAAIITAELERHVTDIMFDAGAELEFDCQLCQQAALLGLWDRFDDGEGWLAELKRRAEVEQ